MISSLAMVRPPKDLPHGPLDRFDRRAATYTPERVGRYNEANRAFPDARATERNLLLDRLRLRPGQALCDADSGGGYLAVTEDQEGAHLHWSLVHAAGNRSG